MQAPLNPGEWVIAESQVSESARDRLGGGQSGL